MAATALAMGVVMVVLDFVLGPSLTLLASNSTILLILTIILVGLFATSEAEGEGAKASRDLARQRRAPPREMVEVLAGARDGYTSNRREIARILEGAVNAKLGAGMGNWSSEAADRYLKTILDAGSYSEFIVAPEQMTTRVEATKGYITRLRDVVALVGQSIGF